MLSGIWHPPTYNIQQYILLIPIISVMFNSTSAKLATENNYSGLERIFWQNESLRIAKKITLFGANFFRNFVISESDLRRLN